jgi:acetyltransferase-like isoleucine patch superfamily enzyme
MKKRPIRTALRELLRLPAVLKAVRETTGSQAPITLPMWFIQKVLGVNREAYWPMHFTSRVGCAHNILVGIASAPGWSPGCYIQGLGKIRIGDYSMLAANVGIISANHDPEDHSKHILGEVNIGRYCWIGLGAVILPNVTLGDFTVVGANSVVTKSFPEGYCIVAGNPAKQIRKLAPEKCIAYREPHEYNGYITVSEFPIYRYEKLKV